MTTALRSGILAEEVSWKSTEMAVGLLRISVRLHREAVAQLMPEPFDKKVSNVAGVGEVIVPSPAIS